MTWSSGLTNKGALALAGLCLAALGGGCGGHHSVARPPLRGSVNLNALVQSHPGWRGVGQYDAALRQLEQAARSLPPPGQPDQRMATLPALAVETGQGGAAPAAAGVSQRLNATQQSLLSSLSARRAMARADQIQQGRAAWRTEARQRFPVPVAAANTQSDLQLQLLAANVQTLTATVNNWKQAPPPAPKLDDLKEKVAAERAKLAALQAERAQAREAASTHFRAQVQQSHEARVAYVQAQADALESQLRADDAHLVTEEAARLSRERGALLAELGSPPSLAIPDAGFAGAETLPHGPGTAQGNVSQSSLEASEMRLRAQRARWIRFLYADTQAAALDVAGRKGWDVTFGPPRPGDRDLTSALTQAMASSVWRL